MKDEYLDTNQIGGYASSTFHSGNTRKYHGLLVVADGDLNRKVTLSALEEKIIVDKKETFLSTNTYKGGILYPNGYKFLNFHSTRAHPSFIYKLDGINIRKTISCTKGQNEVTINYVFDSEKPCTLELTPLVTNRDANSIGSEVDPSVFQFSSEKNINTITLSDTENIEIKIQQAKFIPDKKTYFDFYYPEEANRGYDSIENLYKTCNIIVEIPVGRKVVNISFLYDSGESHEQYSPNRVDRTPLNLSPKLLELWYMLGSKIDDFVVHTKKGTTLMAGYHWFEDWGRDTFVSFKGALLCTSRYQVAKDVLLTWSKYLRNGLLPNRPNKKEYNSIDAPLWYVNAIYQYWLFTQDYDTIRFLFPSIEEIAIKLQKGTDYEIMEDENGFLISNDHTKSLTWMDAQVDSKPIVDRGYAQVEIQMLWYNALSIYSYFLKMLEGSDERTDDLDQHIVRLKENFNLYFWNEKKQILVDSLPINEQITEHRPNAIIGLCLPFQILARDHVLPVIEEIETNLYTKLGLRTLDKGSTNYKGEYSSDQVKRDRAYHNGAVWVWLLGFFVKSKVRYSHTNILSSTAMLEDFYFELKEKGLNYLPEIFSGDKLEPCGCLSQLWSYATILEALYEIDLVTPKLKASCRIFRE